MIEAGDIVQITNGSHHWFPCLVIVREVKSFGCQGYVTIPRNDGEKCGNAYILLKKEDYESVGARAVLVVA